MRIKEQMPTAQELMKYCLDKKGAYLDYPSDRSLLP